MATVARSTSRPILPSSWRPPPQTITSLLSLASTDTATLLSTRCPPILPIWVPITTAAEVSVSIPPVSSNLRRPHHRHYRIRRERRLDPAQVCLFDFFFQIYKVSYPTNQSCKSYSNLFRNIARHQTTANIAQTTTQFGMHFYY